MTEIKDRRIKTPQQVRQLIVEQINALRRDKELDTNTRARSIGYLSNIALTAIRDGETEEKIRDLQQELEAVKDELKRKNLNNYREDYNL